MTRGDERITAGSGPQYLKCSRCKGAGMVLRTGDHHTSTVEAAAAYEHHHGGAPIGPVRCNRCDGTGRVDA